MVEKTNISLLQRARACIPGGVNSPVRAFNSVGGDPIFFERGQGPLLIDAKGNQYIDYVCSWGALILGHTAHEVVAAVQSAAESGLGFGAPTQLEVEMAEFLCQAVPSMEQVRLLCSGTEATMTAIRLARGYTERNIIVKFEGCYHGHSDALLVQAGSGALTLGQPSSAGVPPESVSHTYTLSYNDLAAVTQLFQKCGNQIAAIIVEPVAGNMNCILPRSEFLPGLRQLCDQYGALLIFDEVMTGFRVSFGGAQIYYHVTPDLTTLGKVIGGGLPVAALGGKKAIMATLAPLGPVYQAGTLAGNPLAVTAGLTTLRQIQATTDFYLDLTDKAKKLCEGLMSAAQAYEIPFFAQWIGGMFGFFFSEQKQISCYQQVIAADLEKFKQFFHGMLAAGVYFAPSMYEAGFISSAHTFAEIDLTIAAADTVFQGMAG